MNSKHELHDFPNLTSKLVIAKPVAVCTKKKHVTTRVTREIPVWM